MALRAPVPRQASVGRQHAALVTRGGELFTWGSGHAGKLGLGHTMDACSPQRVHTLWGQSIQHVAAGGALLLLVCHSTYLCSTHSAFQIV